jgi:hypothetical protein
VPQSLAKYVDACAITNSLRLSIAALAVTVTYPSFAPSRLAWVPVSDESRVPCPFAIGFGIELTDCEQMTYV